VLVVGGETGLVPPAALFGKLMATQARYQGIAGIVVDGAVRDIADLRAMQFPVYARGTAPSVGLNRTVGRTQVPVPCGGVEVAPGDWIVGDDDGLVIIPAARIEAVVKATEERLRKEAAYLAAMERGQHLTDLIGFTPLIRQQGETHA
jgi:regulator of RNase E activity RraA